MLTTKWALLLFTLTIFTGCKGKPVQLQSQDGIVEAIVQQKIDSTAINSFFENYAQLKHYEAQVTELYHKHDHNYIWFNNGKLTEFAGMFYSQVNNINDEGLQINIPYREEFNTLFTAEKTATPYNELLISAVYMLYISKVYGGVDIEQSESTGWFLQRDRVCYDVYLDSVTKGTALFSSKRLFSQYYNLKKALKKYRDIEAKGGWGTITMPSDIKQLMPGDTSIAIKQIRTRLFSEGYINHDNGSNTYDKELTTAVIAYKKRHNRAENAFVNAALIKEWNITVSERIKQIAVNMERCRWISPKISASKEFIAVNIPSFRLHYIRDGKPVLISNVVVGKEVTKTVVFNGEMSYIAFSPYWNVPNSILQNEIVPAIKKNPNYLAEHNMEWNGERVRQKPGGNNSLGLVKFMFPNSNNIYLHDTPAKSLFSRDERAFSHGCIRVEKARELAIAITSKDGAWTVQKVDAAMNAGKENIYRLKERIPVYIGYFTAWADENGNTAFFEDIYKRDDKLANLLFEL